MQSKIMNKYFKNTSTLDTTKEGVGMALYKASPSTWTMFFLSFVVGAITWTFVFEYWLAKSVIGSALRYFSKAKALEMLSDIEMQKYIDETCHSLYIKLKKDYPKLEEYTKNDFNEQILMAAGTAGVNKSLSNAIILNKQITKSYKHTIVIFADTTHIDTMYVVFKNKENRQFICVEIPAPTKEQLAKFFK